MNELVKNISENYNELRSGNHRLLNEVYKELLYKIGVEESFVAEKEAFKGVIIGIDQLGRLLIKTNEGIRCFQNKEVRFAGL